LHLGAAGAGGVASTTRDGARRPRSGAELDVHALLYARRAGLVTRD